jgi:hypothetical protein
MGQRDSLDFLLPCLLPPIISIVKTFLDHSSLSIESPCSLALEFYFGLVLTSKIYHFGDLIGKVVFSFLNVLIHFLSNGKNAQGLRTLEFESRATKYSEAKKYSLYLF